MKGENWYYARLQWAVMWEGELGPTEWQTQVHIFLSEDRDTAFQRALEIGRERESTWIVEWQEAKLKLADIVELTELGQNLSHFTVSLDSVKAKPHLPYDHDFHPEKSCPMNPF